MPFNSLPWLFHSLFHLIELLTLIFGACWEQLPADWFLCEIRLHRHFLSPPSSLQIVRTGEQSNSTLPDKSKDTDTAELADVSWVSSQRNCAPSLSLPSTPTPVSFVSVFWFPESKTQYPSFYLGSTTGFVWLVHLQTVLLFPPFFFPLKLNALFQPVFAQEWEDPPQSSQRHQPLCPERWGLQESPRKLYNK